MEDEEDPGEFECEITGEAPPGVGGEHISADAEGLTIYRPAWGKGYLLASSQGDNTFVAFADRGLGGILGSFEIGDGNGIDGVQESDGAAVTSTSLGPRYPKGLLVTHDGYDENPTGEAATNFKLTRWDAVAGAFSPPLLTSPGWR